MNTKCSFLITWFKRRFTNWLYYTGWLCGMECKGYKLNRLWSVLRQHPPAEEPRKITKRLRSWLLVAAQRLLAFWPNTKRRSDSQFRRPLVKLKTHSERVSKGARQGATRLATESVTQMYDWRACPKQVSSFQLRICNRSHRCGLDRYHSDVYILQLSETKLG